MPLKILTTNFTVENIICISVVKINFFLHFISFALFSYLLSVSKYSTGRPSYHIKACFISYTDDNQIEYYSIDSKRFIYKTVKIESLNDSVDKNDQIDANTGKLNEDKDFREAHSSIS